MEGIMAGSSTELLDLISMKRWWKEFDYLDRLITMNRTEKLNKS